MRIRRSIIVVAAVAAGLILLSAWRYGALDSLLGHGAEFDVARAERAVSALSSATAAASQVDSITRPSVAPSAARLFALHGRRDDPRKLAREAANSDDPVLWVRSLELIALCSNQRFGKSVSEDALRRVLLDDKLGLTVEQVAAMSARARDQPPIRWAVTQSSLEALVPIFSRRGERPAAEARSEAEQAMAAPLSEADRNARDRLIGVLRAQCNAQQPNDTFWADFRRAQEKWLAQGATGALLQNTNAGWTSKKFSELSDRDYELVDRIIRERQPDGLARLLFHHNSMDLGLIGETDRIADWRAGMAAIEGGNAVAALAACELGVADCSASSPRFMELCVNAGGCHLPDIASLARYILARDGLDPQWLDRETERVVRAIREGNLGALGIRRKLPQ